MNEDDDDDDDVDDVDDDNDNEHFLYNKIHEMRDLEENYFLK